MKGRTGFRLLNRMMWGALFLAALVLLAAPAAQAALRSIAVLMLGDIRLSPFEGLKKGLADQPLSEGVDFAITVHDAQGDRSRLDSLARRIVDGKPGVAIACGGVEADALKAATQGTTTPVVFLAVASAVERGLVASMPHPGGNLTGIDTNDTQLTAKRLWLIKAMFPNVERVLIPHVPSLTPSVETVKVAEADAPALGIKIVAVTAPNKEQMRQAILAAAPTASDVLYMGMAAPVWQIERQIFADLSEAHGIPIFGNNRDDLVRGAAAVYGCSRFEAGVQAARLVKKILNGASPGDTPAETPEGLEFVINRRTVERLGLTLSNRVWRLANEVVAVDVP